MGNPVVAGQDEVLELKVIRGLPRFRVTPNPPLVLLEDGWGSLQDDIQSREVIEVGIRQRTERRPPRRRAPDHSLSQ